MTATLVLLGALAALLAGLAAGRAWERRRARRRRRLDRRSERGSPHYLLGLDHLVSKQIDLAIEAFTKAARLDSDALEIHLILGNLYRESGHVSKAIQIHQRLLQRPHMTTLERAHVLLCLGRDYKHGGFIDRAAETFSEVARLDPRNTHALLNLEKLHEEQHEWREARVIRQRMAEAAGDEDNPRDQAILAFLESELGLQAMREQRPEQAIRHFEAATVLDSKTVPAYLHLGDVHHATGATRQAITAWEKIMQIAPERAYLALPRLQAAYAASGAPGRFRDLCQRLIDTNPQDWRARLALGQHLAADGDPTRGLDLLLESLVHNPHGLAIHQAIWRALSSLEFRPALVTRYLDLTRDTVFYLDPHVCTRCRYRSTELLWQCPQCHEWNTFVEERITTAQDTEDAPV